MSETLMDVCLSVLLMLLIDSVLEYQLWWVRLRNKLFPRIIGCVYVGMYVVGGIEGS